MSRNNMKKNLSPIESYKKRRRRVQPKQNDRKRLQNANINNKKINRAQINPEAGGMSGINSHFSSASCLSSIVKVKEEIKQAGKENVKFKYIIIDGNNIGMAHGNRVFSAFGLKLAVDFFIERGHKDVKILVPRFRRFESKEYEILDELEAKGYLCFTPSRYLNGKLIVPYDDRFILEAAEHFNAVIVSNDNFCDIKEEKLEWKRLVENNLLQFMFVGDLFLVASDPMGKNGPTLEQFLSKEYENKFLVEK